MSDPTRIVLVRHGETDWNAESRFQGQTTQEPQPSLTAIGLKQGEEVAALCEREYSTASHIYCSDLHRTRQVRPSQICCI